MADDDMDSSSSGCDTNSDMEDEINEAIIKEEIKIYKQKISESDTDYDAHVNLIKALRKIGELDGLREARTQFSQIYPLSPELWTEWLSDERSICTTDEERAKIVKVFEKAVKDYINVPIWVEYILFMLEGENYEATREICEKALTAVGIHFADGILIWQAVLLVEEQIFMELKSEGKDNLIAEQKKRIQNFYRRQARVPLLNLTEEQFRDKLNEWFVGEIDSSIEKDLKKSLKTAATLVSFELELGKANGEVEKLEAYRKYLDFVRKNSNPAFIQITYERAVADLCLHAGIWEEYVKFVMEQFPYAGYVVLPICERSQKNCPWSSTLCYLRIQALQTYMESKTDINSIVKDCVQKSLSSGVEDKDELNNLWMSYIVFLRMQINWEEEHDKSLQDFREACHQAADSISDAVEDTDCEILRFLARIEGNLVKNIVNVRAVYNDNILRCGNNFNRADLWLEFIHLERSCGDTKHTRKLFRRALERVWENVEDIAKEFLKFEQEVGTLEHVKEFERKYKDRLALVQKRRLEEADKYTSEKEYTAKHDKRHSKKESYTSGNKQFQKVVTEFRKKVQPEPQHKTGLKRPMAETEFRQPKKQKVESSKHGETIKHDSSKDYKSVFLSNLDYSTEQEEILPVFENCGEIESFRLVRDFKGRSKGFGYLVFKDASSVQKAIACDRTPLGSRPMYVSYCDNTKSGHTFQYATGLEKEKLFVRGLPVSMKEEDVRELFNPFGKIKNIRLITQRNGFSKGLCYVEYYKSEEAESARVKMDGTEVDGRNIIVLISNPTAKNVPSQDSLQSKFHSAPETSRATFGGRKERINLIPRSIANRSKETKPSDSSDRKEITDAPKTNEEFRKMLLK